MRYLPTLRVRQLSTRFFFNRKIERNHDFQQIVVNRPPDSRELLFNPLYEEEYYTPRERFLRAPLKSKFKALFIGTQLGHGPKKMSKSKLRPQMRERKSCKASSHLVCPCKGLPKKEYPLKIKLPDNTEFSILIWNTGSPEASPKAFLIHVQQLLGVCR